MRVAKRCTDFVRQLSNRLCMCTLTIASNGKSRDLHSLARIFSMDNIYLAGKTPLQVGDMKCRWTVLGFRKI